MAVTWGEPLNFCNDQGHRMPVLSFPNNRIVVLFSDKIKATMLQPTKSFGNSLLAEVGKLGSISVVGKFRFSDHAVCRLDATKVTPRSFVVAARAASHTDEMDAAVTIRQEALAVYGELLDSDLVFDPNTLNIEPEKTEIWGRGVALIAPNTVAYAYQDGANHSIEVAVLEINPTTHSMQLAHAPKTISQGFSPYVSMLPVPYHPSDPHTLVYYQGTSASVVNVCSWTPDKDLQRCEDFTWLHESLTSVSGVTLPGGKSFMVFCPANGVPHYGVFGLSKK